VDDQINIDEAHERAIYKHSRAGPHDTNAIMAIRLSPETNSSSSSSSKRGQRGVNYNVMFSFVVIIFVTVNLTQVDLGQFSSELTFTTTAATATAAPSAVTSTSTSSAETHTNFNYTSRLPPWMSEFFTWQQEQRKLLNETHWKQSHKYLILRCSKKLDAHCEHLVIPHHHSLA
jgi:hypothetical protein